MGRYTPATGMRYSISLLLSLLSAAALAQEPPDVNPQAGPGGLPPGRQGEVSPHEPWPMSDTVVDAARPLVDRPVIEITAPDIRQQVMDMLSKLPRQSDPIPTEAEMRSRLPEPVAAPPRTAWPSRPDVRQDWYEGELRGYRRPADTDDSHVPVPHKTLTIRSLDDLEQVDAELKGGKKAPAEE